MYKFLVIFLLAFLSGCASNEVRQDFGSGKYFQLQARDSLFLQIDTPNAAGCREIALGVKPRENVIPVCSDVSKSEKLRFSFSMTGILTNEKLVVRTQTNEACELFRSEYMSKQDTGKGYKFSECLLSAR
jgi:hypothetical protein